MSTLVVVATVKAKPNMASALRPILLSLLKPTLAEPGCIRYELNEAADGQSWVFTEQWESKSLWDQHMASKHLETFKAAVDKMVAHFELFTGVQQK